MSRFLSRWELDALGLASCGSDVAIDRAALLLNPGRIAVGSHVRIDAFSILSAGPDGITCGDHVHIAAGAMVFGGGGAVVFEDFSGLSGRVCLYTATDDFREGHLTNPTVPAEFRKVRCGPVVLRRHAVVGAGAVILPGVELGFGSAVGALSLVRSSVPECAVVAGNPARSLARRRDRERLTALESRLRGGQ